MESPKQSPSDRTCNDSAQHSHSERLAEFLCGATDTGKVRPHNEDCFLIREEKNLHIVADGMGGYEAGEIASHTAVELIDKHFTLELIAKLVKREGDVETELKLGVEAANKTIIEMAEQTPAYRGMGCTVVTALVIDEILHLCHVGDSRAYLCDQNGIHLLTTDHSAVMDLVKTGRMNMEEARKNPAKNRLSQAVGAQGPVDPEYSSFPLKDGDKILLCTDGLWDMISDQGIFRLLRQNKPARWSCEHLIQAANDGGGQDNITVVVYQHRAQ